MPLPAGLFHRGASAWAADARIVAFPTAIFNGDSSQLAALNAVTATYPLRGHMRIADAPFGVGAHHRRYARNRRSLDRCAHHRATQGGAGRSVAHRRGSFRVTQVLDYRPDQGTGFVNLAPAALINYDDIAATQFVQPGSRVTYCALFAGAPDAVGAFREFLISNKAAG